MLKTNPPETEAELESGSELPSEIPSNGSQPETFCDSQPATSSEFEDLDQQWRSKLLRLAWVIVRDWSLAADAVQNSFLTLHQKWSQIPPENRIGWLVKTVQYSAHNLRRAYSASQPLNEGLVVSDPMENPLHRIDREEQFESALGQLSEIQRQVVQFKLVEGLTFQEIADRLKIPLGTALSRMRLALEKLRTVLKEPIDE